MSILKNDTQKNFTIISNIVLTDPELSIKDRGTLCTLIGLPNDWEFSIEGLMRILPDGYETIHSSIKRLEKMGYLTRTMQRKPNGKFETIIEITLEGRKNNSRHGKPATDNPPRKTRDGKSTTENQGQYKTKDIKRNRNMANNISICHSIEKEGLTESQINPLFIENTKKQLDYEKLKDTLTEAEMKYADRMLLMIAYKKGNPKGNNDIKIGGRYISRQETMAHIINYRYEEVFSVARNMARSAIPLDKPESYYMTALDKQLEIDAPERYMRLSEGESRCG